MKPLELPADTQNLMVGTEVWEALLAIALGNGTGFGLGVRHVPELAPNMVVACDANWEPLLRVRAKVGS